LYASIGDPAGHCAGCASGRIAVPLPPCLEHRVARHLTAHGGSASVDLAAIPAVRLLFGHGRKLHLVASGLSVDLAPGQEDIFKRPDNFSDVPIDVSDSRAQNVQGAIAGLPAGALTQVVANALPSGL
jgi:hypothetical protein